MILPEVQKLNFKKSKNYTSESSEIELQEVQNLNPNYTNISYTDNSYTESINQSILPSGHLPSDSGEGQDASMGEKMIDGIDWIEDVNADTVKKIKENIDYDYHIRYDEWRDKALFDELYEIICEIVCIPRETVRIEGKDYPYGLVRKRFLELTGDHVEYVIGCMHGVTSRISNIKSYMMTALFNAPATINHYYQQEVQHDYGLSAEKEAWVE